MRARTAPSIGRGPRASDEVKWAGRWAQVMTTVGNSPFLIFYIIAAVMFGGLMVTFGLIVVPKYLKGRPRLIAINTLRLVCAILRKGVRGNPP